MAIIAGTTVNWALSPRVITIPVSDTSVTVEDMQDTLQDLEDDEAGIIWPHLRNTSGGEALGGGVTVGWTMELQNAQVAFAPRTTSLSSGTATTANASGTVLIDSTATFVTDGVVAGATIVNFTDQSVTTVISVDSETQLTHYALSDGTGNDWGLADSYKVWNETQCDISGGNVVAIDDIGGSISAISPTFGTQILKTSASSATATSQTALESGLFQGSVCIDVTNGVSGTGYSGDYPIGTRQAPSNNLTDAHTIAVVRGIRNFNILTSMTVTGVDLSDGHSFTGDSPFIVLTLDASADVSNCDIYNLTVQGELDGLNVVRESSVGAVTNANGFFEKCAFTSTVTTNGDINVFECYSQVVGSGYPTFTTGSNDATFRNFRGSVALAGTTTGHVSSMGVQGGRLIIEASCTDGEIHARGEPFEIVQNQTADIVIDETASFKTSDIHGQVHEMWQANNLDSTNPVTRTTTSTAFDSVTIEHTGDCETSVTSTRL